jgi:hypothetical protein
MAKHINDGKCAKCAEIFDRYPSFHSGLRRWFEALQAKHKDAHISNAGRGKLEQEEFFKKKVSKAHYGQSAHNYGCAIDIFQLDGNGQAAWPRGWFDAVVGFGVNVARDPALKWYGQKGSPYFELPHVEVANWRDLKTLGTAELVEPE